TASVNIASTFVVDPSRLIISGGALYVNLQGLTIQSGQQLVLDINGPSTVPEPSSMVFLGTGIAGLIPIVRRRKRV
ncbi:MAG: PEP-CTERM sorting domain-containing protein, partial [Gemmatimonadaceae bacterium]